MWFPAGSSFQSFAILRQKAFRTPWIPCRADAPAKCDDLDIVQDPVVLRQLLHQILLDLFRFGIFRQSEPVGDPLHMGI